MRCSHCNPGASAASIHAFIVASCSQGDTRQGNGAERPVGVPLPTPTPSPTLSCTAPTLAPNPEEDINCDEDGIYDTSPFFTGAGLTYTSRAPAFAVPGKIPAKTSLSTRRPA